MRERERERERYEVRGDRWEREYRETDLKRDRKNIKNTIFFNGKAGRN